MTNNTFCTSSLSLEDLEKELKNYVHQIGQNQSLIHTFSYLNSATCIGIKSSNFDTMQLCLLNGAPIDHFLEENLTPLAKYISQLALTTAANVQSESTRNMIRLLLENEADPYHCKWYHFRVDKSESNYSFKERVNYLFQNSHLSMSLKKEEASKKNSAISRCDNLVLAVDRNMGIRRLLFVGEAENQNCREYLRNLLLNRCYRNNTRFKFTYQSLKADSL